MKINRSQDVLLPLLCVPCVCVWEMYDTNYFYYLDVSSPAPFPLLPLVLLLPTLRCWIKMSRRRVRCSSNSGPSSTRKMLPRNWFKTLRCGSFTCRSRMPSWRTTFIARPRRRSYSPRLPSRPNTAITIRNYTLPVTWPTTAFFRNGNVL